MADSKHAITPELRVITAQAPVNIACVKYWGKADEELNIPLNDSISATISMEGICTTTTVCMGPSLKQNSFYLNGRQVDLRNEPRLNSLLERVREAVEKYHREYDDSKKVHSSTPLSGRSYPKRESLKRACTIEGYKSGTKKICSKKIDSSEAKAQPLVETKSEPSDVYSGVIAAETDSDKAEADSDEAEADSDEAEADSDKAEADSDKAEADSDKAEADSDKAEAGSDKAEARSDKAEADSDKAEADSDKAEADSDKAEARSDKAEADSDKAEADSDKAEARSDKAEADSDKAEAEARSDRAEADSDKAVTGSDQAVTDSDKAEARSDTAEADSDKAEARSDKAEDDSDQAVTGSDQAVIDSDKAEARSDSAEADSDQAVTGSDKAVTGSDKAEADSDLAEADSDQAVTGSDQAVTGSDEAKTEPKKPIPKWDFIKVSSYNNFPTSAGMASSASGYCCLVYALCKMFSIDDLQFMSRLARFGSGSACRSFYGGFARWWAGIDDETSYATQILSEEDWPEMRVLILITRKTPKDVPSREGMIRSAQTSGFLQHRVATVTNRVRKMEQAILEKNFHKFAEYTMRDSNQFHSVCLDTYPPIRYLEDVSWHVMKFVHFINNHFGRNVAAYTFDAGPNATVFCLEDFVGELLTYFLHLFSSPEDGDPEVFGVCGYMPFEPKREGLIPEIMEYIKANVKPNLIHHIIKTGIGSGPEIISETFDDCALIDSEGRIRCQDY